MLQSHPTIFERKASGGSRLSNQVPYDCPIQLLSEFVVGKRLPTWLVWENVVGSLFFHSKIYFTMAPIIFLSGKPLSLSTKTPFYSIRWV